MFDELWDDEITIDSCLAAGAKGVDIPNEKYHELPGISGTKIKYLEESNLHLDNADIFNSGNKQCYDVGNLTHTLALEPHKNNAVIMPSFESKAACGITIVEQKSDFLAVNKSKLIVPNDDYLKAFNMATNVRTICHDIIDNATIERSIFAEYAPGVIIKCRIDAQVDNDDYDLKTFTPPKGEMSEHAIRAHCESMGYYKSAAFRNVVRQTLGVPTGDSYLIFVSTTPGHMVKVRKIPESIISEYEDYIHDLLLLRRRYLHNKIDLHVKEILTKT